MQAPQRRAPQRRLSRPTLTQSPRRLYAYAVGVAAAVGALLIGLSLLSARPEEAAAPAASSGGGAAVSDIASTAALLDGVPQRGNVLGSAAAPVQVVEYADLQCPYCALAAKDVLPTIIREYVRTGKVQIVFRGLAFLGPDSVTALRTATAAGSQNRMWNVVELLYRNQGAENAWVTDELLRSVVAASGASPARVFAARDGTAVASRIDGWQRQATTAGVNSVPAFFVGRRGGVLAALGAGVPPVSDFRAVLDRALQR